MLNHGGKFIVTYTNFGHRRKRIYEAFSNVQPLDAFRQDLAALLHVSTESFPASHNWKHSQPNRKLVKAVNMHLNANIPLVSRMLAVDTSSSADRAGIEPAACRYREPKR